MKQAVAHIVEPSRLRLSHASQDVAWAVWVADHLRRAGYEVVWAGAASVLVVLVSAAKVDTDVIDTWCATPDGEASVVVVRIADVPLPGALAGLSRVDVFGVSVEVARLKLLGALLPIGSPSAGRVPFVPRDFVGRKRLLAAVHRQLRESGRAVLLSPHGWAGVGKTRLAIEYVHRHRADYELVAWIDAEHRELIAAQFARLAVEWGLAKPDMPIKDGVVEFRRHLRHNTGWLLIFDNAESPEDVIPLPKGRGHILLTSRHDRWDSIAPPIEIPVFQRTESVEYLRAAVRGLSEKDAGPIAESLGDLPLSLHQAARVLAATGMTAAAYLGQVAAGQNVATSTAVPVGISLERAIAIDPAAGELAAICSLLSPESVPLDLFTAAPPGALALSPELAVAVGSVDRFYTCTSALHQFGLAGLDAGSLQLHRLTREAITALISDQDRANARVGAEAILVAAQPADSIDPAHWARWDELIPHIFALSPGTSREHGFRSMANAAMAYRVERGDSELALPVAEELLASFREVAGPAHPDTLLARKNLADCLYELGRFDDALRLHQQNHDDNLSLLGSDHDETLDAASAVALDQHSLGAFSQARALNEQTLARYRTKHGQSHPATLAVANNLALNLHSLGELLKARELFQSTLAGKRAIAGPAKIDTLTTAYNLASVLVDLGSYDEAVELYTEAATVLRRLPGQAHPLLADCEAGLRLVRARQDEDAPAPLPTPEVSPRPLSFLVLATEWDSAHGGLSTFNRRMCLALAAAGHKVHCVVLPNADGGKVYDEVQGVRIIRAHRTPGEVQPVDELALARRPSAFAHTQPDFLIGHGRVTGRAAQALTRLFDKVPRLHFIHMSPDEIEWHKPDRKDDSGEVAERRKQIELDLGRTAHRVVTVGPRLYDNWRLEFMAMGAAQPLRFDPGFDFTGPNPSAILDQKIFRVLMFGRAEDDELKGLDFATRALALTVSRRKSLPHRIELLVRGAPPNQSDSLRAKLRGFAGELHLDVKVAPYTAEADKLEHDLHTASLVLMPSRAEGFGLVGLEAIAAGVPVLVSDKSGLGDLLKEALDDEGYAQMVVPVVDTFDEDAEAWSRAIGFVLYDRKSAFRRAADIRRYLADRYTWGKSVDDMVRALTEG